MVEGIMRVTFDHGDSEVVASVHGEIDADNCREFGALLLEDTAGPSSLVVDLAGLEFIDSSGISELLRVTEEVKGRGQALRLREPTPAVHRVLEITGLLDHFGLG
jgi:anti-anti-sigma factor